VAGGGFSNAPALYQQYQNMAPGAERDALVRQMQGSDSGGAYNAAMKQAGWQLNPSQNGQFTYSQAPQAASPYGPGGPSLASAMAQQNGPQAPRNADSVAGSAPPPSGSTGTWSSQGPQAPFGGQFQQYFDQMRNWQPPQFTPEQQLMLRSGRGQRGFWQGPTSPFGMQGPYGGGGIMSPQAQQAIAQNNWNYRGMTNERGPGGGMPK
jgi:hypothetical protein